MVKEHTIQTRNRSIGMLQGGLMQKQVAQRIVVNIRTIRRWWTCFLSGSSLKNKSGRGRKMSIPMPAKLVIIKSTQKKHQSTRYFSQKLKSKGYSISYSTVYRYLRDTLNVKPYKRQRKPKLTENRGKTVWNYVWHERIGVEKGYFLK